MKKKLIFLTIVTTCVLRLVGQGPVILTSKQAQEDFHWLRFALEYVHPRLYKFEDKKVVDARFDSIFNLIDKDISGLDFLALISKLNASVNCGHLYTIPQEDLHGEVLSKMVIPFYLKLVNDEFYIFNDCSPQNLIPDGSKIVSINGRSSAEILALMEAGIATDGYIETRKKRLIERYFYFSFHGFDLYYHLHVDRSAEFLVTYVEYGTGIVQQVNLKGMTIQQRREMLLNRYGTDERAWFKTPSPKFELFEKENFAVLTISRSFYDEAVDPDYDSLLQKSFATLKKKNIQNLVIDLRNNEGGGYEISELLLEDVTDTSYERYIKKAVFKPLNMKNSFYTTNPPRNLANRLATAYRFDGEPIECKYHIYPEKACGAGLWTTAADLARFVIEVQKSLTGDSNTRISKKMAELMLTPYIKNSSYGFGFFIDKKGDDYFFQHSGLNEGFSSQYYGSFKDGNGVVILVNSDNTEFMNEVVNSVATVYGWKNFYPFVPKKRYTPDDSITYKYVGHYKFDNSNTGPEIIKENGNLYLKDPKSPDKWTIYFTSDTDFFMLEAKWANQRFFDDENGKIGGFYILGDDYKMKVNKVK